MARKLVIKYPRRTLIFLKEESKAILLKCCGILCDREMLRSHIL
jgi:hypothetical protein